MGFERIEMERFRDLLLAVMNDDGMRGQILYAMRSGKVKWEFQDFVKSLLR